MVRVFLAAALLSSAAFAQTAPQATPPAATPAQTPAATPAQTGAGEVDDVRREVDAKVENVKKELREEIRAQLATQSVGEGWQEEWTEERRKLELFTVDGYLRVRPDLFHKFDLGRPADPSGYFLFPRSPAADTEQTQAGVNMRFRFEPTLNVSEEVRIRMQVDALDNLVWGSTPSYGATRAGYHDFTLLSGTAVPPRSAINAVTDSISVKRVYGEVSTPVGILRFGRMGSHWGLGLMNNDGNCLDCDYGDTIDRVMFVTEPFSGWYVTPMLDFNVEGPTSARTNELGQPFDLSNSDDAHSFILAIARRDTEQQAKAKLENNGHVFNFGLRFEYRTQKNDANYFGTPIEPTYAQGQVDPLRARYVPRGGSLYIPDLWAKYERKNLRIEAEFGMVFGRLESAAQTDAAGAVDAIAVNILQFGGVLQGEYKLMDGALKLGLEFGLASGDGAPGFGVRTRRNADGSVKAVQQGDYDGPQYLDGNLNNFRFNRDYRVDMILFREILGTITDAMYVKPTVSYELAAGFNLFGSVIGSRSMNAQSTPSAQVGSDASSLLGVEINAGARYETEDGFVASFTYAVLFPLGGFGGQQAGVDVNPSTAQALRALVGIKF